MVMRSGQQDNSEGSWSGADSESSTITASLSGKWTREGVSVDPKSAACLQAGLDLHFLQRWCSVGIGVGPTSKDE